MEKLQAKLDKAGIEATVIDGNLVIAIKSQENLVKYLDDNRIGDAPEDILEIAKRHIHRIRAENLIYSKVNKTLRDGLNEVERFRGPTGTGPQKTLQCNVRPQTAHLLPSSNFCKQCGKGGKKKKRAYNCRPCGSCGQ